MTPLLAAVFLSDVLGSDRTDLPGGVSIIQGPLPFFGLVMTLGLLWHFSTRRLATWADFGAERPESWPRTIVTARLAWAIALIGSSAIFALPHVDQGLEGMIRVGAIGLVFSIAFMLFGRKIWPLVLSHAFIDTMDFISHYFTQASA